MDKLEEGKDHIEVRMNTSELISALIAASERAGNIARICRQDENLLSLLVQEKKDSEKNPRFTTDFKTLADVLVQEMVKHDLCSQFPLLYGHIYGEENNQFVSDGETITVEVKPTAEETANLLNKVIGNFKASKTLSEALYSPITVPNNIIEQELPQLPDNLGVWIDPIDSTAEYIRGGLNVEQGFILSGLPCVTVLLGVFDRDSGIPLIGVINQPFYKEESDGWRGRYVFGFSYNGLKLSQPSTELINTKVIAVSSSEKEEIKETLKQNGYEIVEIAGAGFKLLNIILGQVCGYVLSKPTSYLWDICACHAVLESIGGGIIDFTNLNPIEYKGKKE
ncbi:inositol polyphosphate 1-phosphatase, partial [Halyomorpha halys]|uniref:inositol polyphosphate 1-phosphatase n=1 Tax=Halyomorpha halys TaxID=286706 RepID=UPI0034D20442